MFQNMVNNTSVVKRDITNIIGLFEATLNFERRDTGIYQCLNIGRLVHIFERQQVSAFFEYFAIAICQIVFQSAWLSTFASICRTAINTLTHKTLTAIANTQRAVNETF